MTNRVQVWPLLAAASILACAGPQPTGPSPAPDESSAPVDGPAAPSAANEFDVFALGRVLPLSRSDVGDGLLWSTGMVVGVPTELEHLFDQDWNGAEGPLDAQAAGLDVPVALGDTVTLVTSAGVFEAKITSFALDRMMDDDQLTLFLADGGAPTGQGPGLAILGSSRPSSGARVVAAKPAVLEVPVIVGLQQRYADLQPELVANFEPMDDEADKDAAAAIELEMECMRYYQPQMPPGFKGVVSVECGGSAVYEPRLSAFLVVGEDYSFTPVTAHDDWSYGYGATELVRLVDLDDDGIDELLVEDGGYEYFAERFLAWKDGAYHRFGEASAG